jgi:hypothetical protein
MSIEVVSPRFDDSTSPATVAPTSSTRRWFLPATSGAIAGGLAVALLLGFPSSPSPPTPGFVEPDGGRMITSADLEALEGRNRELTAEVQRLQTILASTGQGCDELRIELAVRKDEIVKLGQAREAFKLQAETASAKFRTATDAERAAKDATSAMERRAIQSEREAAGLRRDLDGLTDVRDQRDVARERANDIWRDLKTACGMIGGPPPRQCVGLWRKPFP